MRIRDNYVIWDGVNEEPFTKETEDMLRHQCIITPDVKLLSISEILAIANENPLIVPTIIFSCKSGQTATEKKFNGESRGVFSYFWNALLRRDPKVTFRDAISLVNIDMQQEGLEQRGEVICRIDVLDMPMMNSPFNERSMIIFQDICRTKQTLAEIQNYKKKNLNQA